MLLQAGWIGNPQEFLFKGVSGCRSDWTVQELKGCTCTEERGSPHFICRPASPEGMIFCNQAHISKVVRGCLASSAVKSSALPTQNTHLCCQPMLLRHRTGLQHKPARMPDQSQNTSIPCCECIRLKGL